MKNLHSAACILKCRMRRIEENAELSVYFFFRHVLGCCGRNAVFGIEKLHPPGFSGQKLPGRREEHRQDIGFRNVAGGRRVYRLRRT